MQPLQVYFEFLGSYLLTQYEYFSKEINNVSKEIKHVYQETAETVSELPYESYYNFTLLFMQENMQIIGIALLLVLMIVVIVMQFMSKRKQEEIISSLQCTESMDNFRLKARVSALEYEVIKLTEECEKVKQQNEYIHKLRQNKAGYVKITGDPSNRNQRKEMKKYGTTYLGNKVYLVSMKHMGNFRNRLITQ